MPIAPVTGAGGLEWTIPPIDASATPKPEGFGALLADQISQLQKTQTDAAEATRGVVTGTADPTSAVMALERARLSMQLAAQIRSKGVEAFQSIMSTPV